MSEALEEVGFVQLVRDGGSCQPLLGLEEDSSEVAPRFPGGEGQE